jgi:WD40 repeat protein
MKMATNKRYLLAPTMDGKVFVWNLRSAQLVGILNDHDGAEIRDIIFHPTKRMLLTCGDGEFC